MPKQSRGDWVSTTSRRCARSNEDDIGHFHEQELLQIIEPFLIDDLPEQFVGRLSTVFLESWHVDIVHVKDHLLASQWTDLSSSLLREFILVQEHVQQVFGAGLGREVHDSIDIGLGVSCTKEISNND